MNRRAFLTWVGAGWLVHAALPERSDPGGRLVGASHAVGHWLRDGKVPAPSGPAERADVVVVGAGASGLSAAWRLAALGIEATVLDLEPFPGGTSTWGDDGVVPHPWGAHYLAAPNPEAKSTLRLLQQMGAVTHWDAAGRPRFEPSLLCHAPQERLFFRGAWRTGLVPFDLLTREDRAQMERFAEVERQLLAKVGSDGRPAFTIPMDRSSRDPEGLALDRMSMSAWLDREGFTSPFVRWYVRYATLDDFGGEPEDVSAWAGLHYFGARKLRTEELEGSHFLVWPEGNGRLVKELLSRARPRLVQRALCTRVTPSGSSVTIDVLDAATGEARRIEARGAILATPAFVTRRIFAGAAERGVPVRASSPWIVANLHVKRPVDPNLPWDSVIYGAEGLGYVDARHQLTSPAERTVLTYFRAYGEPDVAARRGELVSASWESLAERVLRDLAPAHPDLRDELERIDVMVWGHAMPRPRPGFLGEKPFEVPCALDDRVAWAHVDQSGMALFEEANARGVHAAEVLAKAIGRDPGETWL